MPKKQIYFVRHGETEWNKERRFQGGSDIPLNDAGRLQARSLALRIGAWRDVELFSSTLSRAHDTAEMLASACGGVVKLRGGLTEMRFGAWEGITIFEAKSRDSQKFREWEQNPFRYTPPGGESFEAIRSRLLPVLEEALDSKAERTLLVSHGGIIRAALSILLGLSTEAVWKVRLLNCSVTAIESGRRGVVLLFLNDSIHTSMPANLVAEIPFPA